MDALFSIHVFIGSKFDPSLADNICLRVPPRNFGRLALSHARLTRKTRLSAG